MPDGGSLFRIREGAFSYLLAAEQAMSIQHRGGGGFEFVDDPASALAAWRLSDGIRIPLVRLGRLLGTPAGDWGYAVLLSGGPDGVGLAAEHVELVTDSEKPAVQPFNPVGCSIPGGPLITGVTPDTEPERLVLDPARLRHCLRRAVA